MNGIHMKILHVPTLLSFLGFLGLGAYLFLRNKGDRVNLFFALGMGSLALMEFGNVMALLYLGSETCPFWKRISSVGECLVPVTWLAFSMSFGRREPWYSVKERKMGFVLVGAASAFFAASAASGLLLHPGDSPALLNLGGIGKAFYIFFLLGTVAVVANLEHTIRHSKGDQRTKIRSLFLGVAGVFVFLIFTTSQTLLFSRVNLGILPVGSSIFIICAALIAFSVARHQLMDVNLYVSRFVIYNSLTILVVGGYLFLVGLVSQVVRSFDLIPAFPLEILLIFVAILFLLGLFLSNRIRWKAKMLINRHFYRSQYSYRAEWRKFSEGLSLKLDIDDLMTTIVDILKDSVGVDKASLWLHEENTGSFKLVGSSPSIERVHLKMDQTFLGALLEKQAPFSIDASWARDFVLENSEIFERVQAALVLPLVSRKEMVGLVLLGKKTTGEKYLGEDFDLLRSAAAQVTSAIVNAKVSRELIKAKEMEVFHRFSSFVLHDLKNLVSNLSLVVQNAGEHMTDPQFQQDALETVGRSVEKMEGLIARLSNNTIAEKPNFQEVDLNESVTEVIARMGQNGLNSKTVRVDLRDIPRVLVDREQIEKVVVNLLLNAFDALGDNGGLITIRTEGNEDTVILSVSDNGRGMSADFLEKFLFKPFKSTKRKGLGIGLYQCKTIVEAHRGRIEVETEEGVGSTFRVILPAAL